MYSNGTLDIFEASKVLLGRNALDMGIRVEECISQFDASGDGLIDEVEFEALFRMMIDKGLLPRPRHPR